MQVLQGQALQVSSTPIASSPKPGTSGLFSSTNLPLTFIHLFIFVSYVFSSLPLFPSIPHYFSLLSSLSFILAVEHSENLKSQRNIYNVCKGNTDREDSQSHAQIQTIDSLHLLKLSARLRQLWPLVARQGWAVKTASGGRRPLSSHRSKGLVSPDPQEHGRLCSSRSPAASLLTSSRVGRRLGAMTGSSLLGPAQRCPLIAFTVPRTLGSGE